MQIVFKNHANSVQDVRRESGMPVIPGTREAEEGGLPV
jgi:hypothetical protein